VDRLVRIANGLVVKFDIVMIKALTVHYGSWTEPNPTSSGWAGPNFLRPDLPWLFSGTCWLTGPV